MQINSSLVIVDCILDKIKVDVKSTGAGRHRCLTPFFKSNWFDSVPSYIKLAFIPS